MKNNTPKRHLGKVLVIRWDSHGEFQWAVVQEVKEGRRVIGEKILARGGETHCRRIAARLSQKSK